MQTGFGLRLLIGMPTHERKATAIKTILTLHKEYTKLGFEVHAVCIDSSKLADAVLFSYPFISYIHVRGASLQRKYIIARDYIQRLHVTPAELILWTTDDDLYLPSKSIADFAARTRHAGSKFIIPFRYLFFSYNMNTPDQITISEQWTHHIHIASVSCTPANRLSYFVSQGVNSCWGLFSRSLFLDICDLTEAALSLLHENDLILMEDLWNIVNLSAEWISLEVSPICLRGNDRRFSAQPGWKPSWIAWREMSQIGSARKLGKLVFEALTRISQDFLVIPEPHQHKYGETLIDAHTKGYAHASSRAFGSGLSFILSIESGNTREFPMVELTDKKNGIARIWLPSCISGIQNWIYPKGHLMSDEFALSLIYRHKNYMCSQRDK